MHTHTKSIKFGDIEKGAKIYYIDPFARIIEPAFVIGVDRLEGHIDHTQLTVVLIPKKYREAPLNELDVSVLRKIIFGVPRNLDLALVKTNPPTIYSTEEKTLATWIKFH